MVDENTDSIGSEHVDSLDPEDRQYGAKVQRRINKTVYERNVARDALGVAEAKAAALEAQLAAERAERAAGGANGGGAESPKQGWDRFPDEELDNYDETANATIIEALKVALANNEEAAPLLDQIGKLRPDHMTAVRNQRMLRTARNAASAPVEELKSSLAENGKAEAFKSQLQNELRSKFGDEVLNMDSDLMTRAAELYREIAPRFGNNDSNGAITWQAVEAASREGRENDRGGRGLDDRTHRLLAVEGEARRDASRNTNTAALQRAAEQGDYVASKKLVMNNIAEWLEGGLKHEQSQGR